MRAVLQNDKITAFITNLNDNLDKSVALTVTRATKKLAKYVQDSKLSGQVLNVRTGNLRNSIKPTVERETFKIVGTVGTSVTSAKGFPYGKYWEYSGRSFLRSALADLSDDIIKEILDGVK